MSKSQKKMRNFLLALCFTILVTTQHELAATPRNVILFIGDGMGPQQIGLLSLYARKAPNSIYAGRESFLDIAINRSSLGLMQVDPHSSLVVDSACSITQITSGKACESESLGKDANGADLSSILVESQKLGKSVGLVSDTRITHATPAGAFAHQNHRSNEDQIAEQLLKANPDLILSSGLANFLNTDELKKYYSGKITRSRNDAQDLLKLAKANNYQIATKRSEFENIFDGKLLGLFGARSLPDAITENNVLQSSERDWPTLSEMTRKSLSILEKDKDGFFLMVEAGQIDWAGHDNDAGLLLHEMLRMDKALAEILSWIQNRNDTLLIITADHETGGFGFSYMAAKEAGKTSFAMGNSTRQDSNFLSPTILDSLYQQRKSLRNILEEFDELPAIDRTAHNLMLLFNKYSFFKIKLEDAERILKKEKNRFFTAGHKYLSEAFVPKISDFSAFYSDPISRRTAIFSRIVSEQSGVVWASGGHTSTPVVVAALGTDKENFAGSYHATELGQRMLKVLRGE